MVATGHQNNAPYCIAIRSFVNKHKRETCRTVGNTCGHFGASRCKPHSSLFLFLSTMDDGVEIGADMVVIAEDVLEVTDSEDIAERIGEATEAVNKILDDGGVAIALSELQKLVDDQGGQRSPTPWYSPSTVVPEDNHRNSLQEARDMVIDGALEEEKKRQYAPEPVQQVEDDVDADEVIEEAVKKMRQSAPGGLKLPWEFGFAGLVLGGGSSSFMDVGMSMRALTPKGLAQAVEVEKRRAMWWSSYLVDPEGSQ